MQKIIILSGPTGIGKTETIEAIYHHIPCEIINVDIGSFYSPLTIGTAKPDLNKISVPHHLLNIFDKPADYTIADFRKRAQLLVQEIHARKNIPLFVGGSVFYIQSLFYKCPEISNVEISLVQELEKKNSLQLWKELNELDPLRATQIHSNDHYRLVRALSIYYSTGKKPSSFSVQFQPIGCFYTIFLQRDRQDLYQRINERTSFMLKHGWIEETQSLQNTIWEEFLIEKKVIGYDAILRYLWGKKDTASYQELENIIAQTTRNYAKRQITFLKKLEKQLKNEICGGSDAWRKQCVVAQINLTLYEHRLYIKHLLNSLENFIR